MISLVCSVQAAQQCSDTKEYKCEEADRVVSSGTMDQGLRLGLNLGFIHHCIPKEWRCDGEADCVNKDDEKGCDSKRKHGGIGSCATYSSQTFSHQMRSQDPLRVPEL